MKVLIVEDEDYSREAIEAMALAHDSVSSVHSCSFAQEAISLAQNHIFEVALLDIDLPDISGLELAEKLNTLIPTIKIIFITAFNHYAAEAFEVYAVDYLLKPLRREKLHSSLSRVEKKLASLQPVEHKSNDTLYIRCLGKFEVWLNGELVAWKRSKSREIFAYLLSHKNSPLHKEKICDNVFRELPLDKAIMHLQSAISQLRRLGFEIRYTEGYYYLVIPPYTSDLEELLTLCESYQLSEVPKEKLDQQMALIYRGDLFEDEGWLWSYELAGFYRRAYERVAGYRA